MSLRDEILARKKAKDRERWGEEADQKIAHCRRSLPSMDDIKAGLLEAAERHPYPDRIQFHIGLDWGCVEQDPETRDYTGISCPVHTEFVRNLEREGLEWEVSESTGSYGAENLDFFIKMPRAES